MIFSAEGVITLIHTYSKLPKTPEKDKIDNQYLNNEISTYEFYSLAKGYIESVEKQ